MKYVVVRGLFQFLLKLLPAVKFFDHLAVASSVTHGTDGKRDFLRTRCLVASYIKCIFQCVFCNTALPAELCGLMERESHFA